MTKAVPDKSKTGFARRVASRGLDVLLPYRSEARKLKQATDALKRKVGGLTQDSARLKQERHGHIETIKALRQQCGELERIAEFLYGRLQKQGGIEPDAGRMPQPDQCNLGDTR